MADPTVDEHLAGFAEPQRAILQAIRERAHKLLPTAVEGFAYGMPCLRIDGEKVLGFDGFVRHVGLFPMSGSVVPALSEELAAFAQSKGGIQIPLDRPFPPALLKRMIEVRIAEINASYPKKNGQSKEFYDNGVVKFAGKVKGEAMHGPWEWRRRDGSLMRTGSFANGEQIGTWTTYARDGRVVKVTDFG